MYQPKDLTTFPIGSGAPEPYPYGGRTMPSIIARLRRLRTSAIARWRPRLLLRGWRQICFYSFDLAGKFIRAFCRLTPRLGLKEMALWTDCAVKLARSNAEMPPSRSAGPVVFHEGGYRSTTEIFFKMPPACPVESHDVCCWVPTLTKSDSGKREAPPDKPVASFAVAAARLGGEALSRANSSGVLEFGEDHQAPTGFAHADFTRSVKGLADRHYDFNAIKRPHHRIEFLTSMYNAVDG